MLSANEIHRYHQQMKLEEIGLSGQNKLKQARILCIGAGGLGSSLLLYLAGSGVGTIGIVDGDRVEETNLHRQLLYTQLDLGREKTLMAKNRLNELNPYIQIATYSHRINAENAESIINQYDLVADCSDNFSTRYLIHDTCFRLKKPYAYATAIQFRGHCSLFVGSPCLRCLFPVPSAPSGNCTDEGVCSTTPGIMGLIQANEIIKWIIEKGNPLNSRLLMVDLLAMNFREIHRVKNPACTFCNE